MKIWVHMRSPFLYEVIEESMWRAMGWVCDERTNAVIDSLKSVFRRRSIRQGRLDDVWDKIATDWAGKEHWMSPRKKRYALADETQFVTFALDSVKLSTVHRKAKGEGKGKKDNGKTPRTSDPRTQPSTHVMRGLTVQLCGDSKVASKWINGQYSLGQKYRGRISQIQKNLYSWWKKTFANPISKMNDFVKHVFREHNQEADRWANLWDRRTKASCR